MTSNCSDISDQFSWQQWKRTHVECICWHFLAQFHKPYEESTEFTQVFLSNRQFFRLTRAQDIQFRRINTETALTHLHISCKQRFLLLRVADIKSSTHYEINELNVCYHITWNVLSKFRLIGDFANYCLSLLLDRWMRSGWGTNNETRMLMNINSSNYDWSSKHRPLFFSHSLITMAIVLISLNVVLQLLILTML